MRRLLILAAIALATSSCARNPAQDSVESKVHKMCLQAKDYMGCVKAQTTKGTEVPNLRLIQGEIELTGNSCPSDYAYVGGGVCKEVVCNDDLRHDKKLTGKGWSCKDRRGLMTLFNISLKLWGPPVRATTDKRCPLVEPEYGRRNSCQNGLTEQQIFESTNPLIKGDTPKKRLPMACKNGVWDKDHPKCQLPEETILSPMDMD